MRISSPSSATVVVLNPAQTAQLARNASVANEYGNSLDVIDGSDLLDDDLEALGLANATNYLGPANRPDPVDVISIRGPEPVCGQLQLRLPVRIFLPWRGDRSGGVICYGARP